MNPTHPCALHVRWKGGGGEGWEGRDVPNKDASHASAQTHSRENTARILWTTNLESCGPHVCGVHQPAVQVLRKFSLRTTLNDRQSIVLINLFAKRGNLYVTPDLQKIIFSLFFRVLEMAQSENSWGVGEVIHRHLVFAAQQQM